jgi:polar amino acid transport system permease protein
VASQIDTSSTGATPSLFAPRRRLLFTGRRGTVASVISTVLVIGGLIAVFYLSPGGAAVRYAYFNPHLMWEAFVGDPADGLSSVGRGFLTNIWMFLVCEPCILFFGLAIAWIRISKSPVLAPFRILATVYSDVFRGIPGLLVVALVGFGVRGLSLGWISNQSPAVYACIALIMSYSAYVAEVLRAGIYSVPNGQIMAAKSLGLTDYTTMRRVILPQAVRTVIPPLLNDFISLQKDTALASIIGVVEAVNAATIFQDSKFNSSGLVVASLLFLALTVPLTRFTDHLIAKDRARRLAGS